LCLREGSEVTRLTLSYRKPAYSLGDIVRWKRENWIVSAWQKDGSTLRRLDRNERTGVTWRDMEKLLLFAHSGRVDEALNHLFAKQKQSNSRASNGLCLRVNMPVFGSLE
jgi:hypothetical protein